MPLSIRASLHRNANQSECFCFSSVHHMNAVCLVARNGVSVRILGMITVGIAPKICVNEDV